MGDLILLGGWADRQADMAGFSILASHDCDTGGRCG
jgi:hypothetical protein